MHILQSAELCFFYMKNIIVIPARGNSKGIKKKNLINFCNKPLLYWTLKQAKKTKMIKDIYVSTESTEMADLALMQSILLENCNVPTKIGLETQFLLFPLQVYLLQ